MIKMTKKDFRNIKQEYFSTCNNIIIYSKGECIHNDCDAECPFKSWNIRKESNLKSCAETPKDAVRKAKQWLKIHLKYKNPMEINCLKKYSYDNGRYFFKWGNSELTEINILQINNNKDIIREFIVSTIYLGKDKNTKAMANRILKEYGFKLK